MPERHDASLSGLRLHLGCGEQYLDGYLNIDYPPDAHTVQQRTVADKYADIRTLTYASCSVAEVRLHHVFEHFDRITALRLLLTWYDWLGEGGVVTIETPDFTRSIREIQRTRNVRVHGKLLRHLFGTHEAAWAVHADGWYREKFELTLGKLGFSRLVFTTEEWHGTYNITVRAAKYPPYQTRASQLAACRELLRLHLVDETPAELRLLETWMGQLGQCL